MSRAHLEFAREFTFAKSWKSLARNRPGRCKWDKTMRRVLRLLRTQGVIMDGQTTLICAPALMFDSGAS